MKLKLGDKVRPLNETGEGIVTKVLDEQWALVELEGFEHKYATDELVRISVEQGESGTAGIINKDEKETELRVSVPHRAAKEKGCREIDLHIEKLAHDFSGLSNSEILNVQLAHFVACLDEAVKNNEKRIVFIHGVGEGVLRHEIRKALKEYANVDFEDASFAKYGSGATEVIIR